MSGGYLDVDAAGAPVGIGVLQLRIGIVHAPVLVDGQAQVLGGTAPLGIGRLPTVSHAGGFATAGDDALQLGIEPDPPEGGALYEQALAFPLRGPIDGRVMDGLRALKQPGGDLLFRIQPCLMASFRAVFSPREVNANTLNDFPFSPEAVDSRASPSSIQRLTARRVV